MNKTKNKKQKTKNKKQKTKNKKQKTKNREYRKISHLFFLYDKKSFSAHMPCKQHTELELFLDKEVTNLSLVPSH
jgi:hypothetical protein